MRISDWSSDVCSSDLFDKTIFDRDCRLCPRLSDFLDTVAEKNPGYWCRPVPPFGDRNARLVIVGLAPGMHGANRTGRPFTGDFAGEIGSASVRERVCTDV